VVEFDHFKMQAGLPSFVLSVSEWIEKTNAIGIIVRKGKYGGTFAHKDIAFEFGSAISVPFKLYLITEFQRLKEEEQKQLGWTAKRELAKLNYHIHTDAIKHNLIPKELSTVQTSIIYASEADVLNVALFGITAKQWRDTNPGLKGNIRDYATIRACLKFVFEICFEHIFSQTRRVLQAILGEDRQKTERRMRENVPKQSQRMNFKQALNELICLSNMENLNAVFINEKIPQKERLIKLNKIAIQQMKILQDAEKGKLLK
jgi:hypothetical protein